MTRRVRVVIALALCAVVAVVCFRFESDIAPSVQRDRGVLYQMFGSFAGTMLGFVMSVSSWLITTVQGPRFEPVRKSDSYKHLWPVFLDSMLVLLLATVASFVAVVVDGGRDPLWPVSVTMMALFSVLIFQLALNVGLMSAVLGTPSLSGERTQPPSPRQPRPLNGAPEEVIQGDEPEYEHAPREDATGNAVVGTKAEKSKAEKSKAEKSKAEKSKTEKSKAEKTES